MVVFASEKNRRNPGARLHTDFKLSGAGEYLALVKPDGVTIVERIPADVPGTSAGCFAWVRAVW